MINSHDGQSDDAGDDRHPELPAFAQHALVFIGFYVHHIIRLEVEVGRLEGLAAVEVEVGHFENIPGFAHHFYIEAFGIHGHIAGGADGFKHIDAFALYRHYHGTLYIAYHGDLEVAEAHTHDGVFEVVGEHAADAHFHVVDGEACGHDIAQHGQCDGAFGRNGVHVLERLVWHAGHACHLRYRRGGHQVEELGGFGGGAADGDLQLVVGLQADGLVRGHVEVIYPAGITEVLEIGQLFAVLAGGKPGQE